jgi:hypothetical protein
MLSAPLVGYHPDDEEGDKDEDDDGAEGESHEGREPRRAHQHAVIT